MAVIVTAPGAVLDAVERYDAAVFEELFIVASVSSAKARSGGDGFEDRGRETPVLPGTTVRSAAT